MVAVEPTRQAQNAGSSNTSVGAAAGGGVGVGVGAAAGVGAGGGAGVGLWGLLDLLEAGVDGLADAGVHAWDGGGCVEAEQRMWRLVQRLEGLRLTALAAVDQQNPGGVEGAETCLSWLKQTRHVDHGTAVSDLRSARATRLLPQMSQALNDGEIGRKHLDAIATRISAHPQLREEVTNFDEIFTTASTKTTPRQLARIVEAWADQLRPTDTAKAERHNHDRRGVYLSPLAGGWDLRGFLDSEQGTILKATLDAIMQQTFKNQHTKTKTGTGTDTTGTEAGEAGAEGDGDAGTAETGTAGADTGTDTSGEAGTESEGGTDAGTGSDTGANTSGGWSKPQQRADALTRMAQIAAAVGDLPTTGGLPPVVTITIPLHRLEETNPEPSPNFTNPTSSTNPSDYPELSPTSTPNGSPNFTNPASSFHHDGSFHDPSNGYYNGSGFNTNPTSLDASNMNSTNPDTVGNSTTAATATGPNTTSVTTDTPATSTTSNIPNTSTGPATDTTPAASGTTSAGEPSGRYRLPFVNDSAWMSTPDQLHQTIVSTETALRLTCDCHIHRILLDPDGLPLDVGRTTRTIPHHIRKALNLRDNGCTWPGCDKPSGWCQAHHSTHWAHGGETSLENLTLLCNAHHQQTHQNQTSQQQTLP